MTENNRSFTEHNVIMNSRSKLSLSGVGEIISFEEDNVELETSGGELTIRGENLKMEGFNSEVGDLDLSGKIYALVYVNSKSEHKGGIFKRIFK